MNRQMKSGLMLVLSLVLSFNVAAEDMLAESGGDMVVISCDRSALDLSADPTVQAESRLYRNLGSGMMIGGGATGTYFLLLSSADEKALSSNLRLGSALRSYLETFRLANEAQARFVKVSRDTQDFIARHNLGQFIDEMKAKAKSDPNFKPNPNYFLDRGNVSEGDRRYFQKLSIDRVTALNDQQRLSGSLAAQAENLRKIGTINLIRRTNSALGGLAKNYEARAASYAQRVAGKKFIRTGAGVAGTAVAIMGTLVYAYSDELAINSKAGEAAQLGSVLECLGRHQENKEGHVTPDEQMEYEALRYFQGVGNNDFLFQRMKE